jgi:putative zinc finger/helix-turn-helix YgiT family protein
MKCVTCGHLEMTPGMVDEAVPVGELIFSLRVPALVCPKCGENYLTADTMGQVDRLVAGALARDGVATSQAFRFMRKAIGLRAVELAELFAVTPETVSRWETGERAPAGEAVKLLALLVVEHLAGRSEALDYLRSLRRAPAEKSGARCLEFPSQLCLQEA